MTATITDFLTGTVKGPGEMPHEYLFITKDNKKTRIGEFVYYAAEVGDEKRRIIGTIKARKLVRNLPDAFLSDPNTPPSLVSSLIGLNGDACEIYEITVETIPPSKKPSSVIGKEFQSPVPNWNLRSARSFPERL